jgi:hypothetical protein
MPMAWVSSQNFYLVENKVQTLYIFCGSSISGSVKSASESTLIVAEMTEAGRFAVVSTA